MATGTLERTIGEVDQRGIGRIETGTTTVLDQQIVGMKSGDVVCMDTIKPGIGNGQVVKKGQGLAAAPTAALIGNHAAIVAIFDQCGECTSRGLEQLQMADARSTDVTPITIKGRTGGVGGIFEPTPTYGCGGIIERLHGDRRKGGSIHHQCPLDHDAVVTGDANIGTRINGQGNPFWDDEITLQVDGGSRIDGPVGISPQITAIH